MILHRVTSVQGIHHVDWTRWLPCLIQKKIMKRLWRERERERERDHKKQRNNYIDSLQYITYFENQLLYDNFLNQCCYKDTYMFIHRWLLHRQFWQGLPLRVDSLQSHAPPLGSLRRFWCLHSGWFKIITLT